MASTHGISGEAALVASIVAAISLFSLPPAAQASNCEALKTINIADTTVLSAVAVPAGDLTTEDKITRKGMPAICRVVASVKDAPDSDIRIEMWLPDAGWKGVFQANGSGGFGGVLPYNYGAMETSVRRGYASAITDMGTAPATPLSGDALVGHPQKWKDWGLLSTHVMAVVGKQIAKAFYGSDARHAYFSGCSTGGQQGLIEAQYYPDDFDGILAGAPVVNRTWGHAAVVWDYQAANLKPGHKLSDAKLALLTKSAVKSCGGNANGLTSDPYIADPTGCDFDPASLACKGGMSVDCLTADEVETAKAFYSGPRDETGKTLYYGWAPGSESGSFNWGFLETPANAPDEPSFDGLFKWVFGADWNWRDFDAERDMPKVDAALALSVNGATTGDLSKFHDRGGKLILFQGWADPIVPEYQTIDFYKNAIKKFGGVEKTQTFARLFMVPGMGHCGGGDGPNRFDSTAYGGQWPPSTDAAHDMFTALSQWVEEGIAPDSVIATKYEGNDAAKGIGMQRPLCPYPKRAWYKGEGNAKDAANFTCSADRK